MTLYGRSENIHKIAEIFVISVELNSILWYTKCSLVYPFVAMEDAPSSGFEKAYVWGVPTGSKSLQTLDISVKKGLDIKCTPCQGHF